MTVEADAETYYLDVAMLYRQATAAVLKLWGDVDVSDFSRSWAELLPEAAGIVVAAQTVAAEMADPYLTQILDDSDLRYPEVDPTGFAGQTAAGMSIGDLLYLPTILAKESIARGVPPLAAKSSSRERLALYARGAVADSGRLAVSAGMGARSHVSGYYRKLRLPSCKRCAIIAGRWYRWNRGFKRHPRCDCQHIPVREADGGLAFDARKAIASGQVRGLNKAQLKAIELGANPAQVVNAEKGMFTAGSRRFTHTGTTTRGIAGARILAKGFDRAIGLPTGGEYRNFTFDRLTAAKYTELFRRGKTYTRITSTGREQRYAYRFTKAFRPTPEQIVASASSRAEAVLLLKSNGYIL